MPETINPFIGEYCKYCGSSVRIEFRPELVASGLTSFSLAGAQMKVSATKVEWPWMVCNGCGRESKGKK